MRRWSELPRGLRSAAVLLLLLAAGLGGIRYCQMVERTFSAERWRAAAPGTEIRGKMARDLVDSRRLVGMRRAGLLELLGPPDREIRGSSPVWVLGRPQEGYGIDDDYLQADLRPDGTVEQVHIYSG